ncbi:hypothetical protein K9L63_01195 [Candidatus Gracilibacteria bacterium]|nr:hypothetical protein [Candidatus Gracilibacteria bacterium]
MKMRVLLLLSAFLITGCGGENTEVLPKIDSAKEKFQVGPTTWELILPPYWEKLTPPENSAALYLAHRGMESFVILLQKRSSEDIATELWDSAKQDFFSFEEIHFSPHQWRFQAKTTASDPLHEFHQKIFPVPETSFFLLGSCSFPVEQERSNECETIFNSWEISKTQ